MDGPDKPVLAESSLRAALLLDVDESDYLTSLDLAGRWRQQPAASSAWWGWMSLAATLAAFGAWWLSAPFAAQVAEAASRTGLTVLLLRTFLMLGVGFGQTLFTLATSPGLTYALGVLALAAVLLLAWPGSRDRRSEPRLA